MTPAKALIKRYAQDTVIPIDYGIPFNPLSSPEENLDAPVHKREVGYLGIFLVIHISRISPLSKPSFIRIAVSPKCL